MESLASMLPAGTYVHVYSTRVLESRYIEIAAILNLGSCIFNLAIPLEYCNTGIAILNSRIHMVHGYRYVPGIDNIVHVIFIYVLRCRLLQYLLQYSSTRVRTRVQCTRARTRVYSSIA